MTHAQARAEPTPFEDWPVMTRVEAARFVLRTFPQAPAWLAYEVAGDAETFNRVVQEEQQ